MLYEVITLAGRGLVGRAGGRTAHPDPALRRRGIGGRAVRAGDWKLAALADGEWELFDLSTDRAESTDVSADHPEKVAHLAGLWSAWWERMQQTAD